MKQPFYVLTKAECLYIATKFNDEARARLILRWEELENEKQHTAPQQPATAPQLPPPIDNQHCISGLTEIVEGKPVTTSRKLARILGRKHRSLTRTIGDNLHSRAFKYGHFTRRAYTSGMYGHGYEYLITQKGLDALMGVMRYGAKDTIKKAYKGAWGMAHKALPQPEVVALPFPEANDTVETVGLLLRQPEAENQNDATHELAKWIDDLRYELRMARDTQRRYSEMFETERRRRIDAMDKAGRLQDLYNDLLWSMLDNNGDSSDEKIKRHLKFREKITQKVKKD